MCTLANSKDADEMPHYADEMPHNVAFHQRLHCLLRQKLSSDIGIQLYFTIIICSPSNYTLGHTKCRPVGYLEF